MTIEISPPCCGKHLVLLDHGEALCLSILLKAIADPVRLCLLNYIAESPNTTVCACHLPAALGITQPTLSHHLKKLAEVNLITRTQQGRWAHYRLNRETMERLTHTLSDFVAPGGQG